MELKSQITILLILVSIIVVQLEGVTVKPSLCPTNKIAPHRRTTSWDPVRARTLGAFYDLFTHNNLQNDAPSSLQEQPQEDDPDDCGEIEDYDENDLSSLSPSRRRQGHSDNRFFLGGLQNRPQYPPGSNPNPPRPPPPTYRPPQPQRPYPPTRPPYWSGGFFGNNPYRPPLQQHPSDNIKPVHEDGQEAPVTYNPGVVGGPLGHVVGVTQVTPTRYPLPDPTSQRSPQVPVRFPERIFQTSSYPTRAPRPRRINNSGDSVFGSFLDLLFK